MRTKLCFGLIVSLATLFSTSSAAWAIALGQIDDFQDGTTQGWRAGNPSPVPPVNSTDQGPGGVGDHALLFATNGSGGGPGSKLVVFNRLQWAGDYLAAGVNQIDLDVRNLSGRDVNLRLAADGGGGRFSTTNGFLLPANSGWQSLQFPISAADWTPAGGASINATLANVTELRLVDNPLPSFFGETGAAEVLVDNITAAVPEPSTLALTALTGIAFLTRRRRG